MEVREGWASEGLPVTLFLVGLVVSGIVGYITVKYLHPVSRRAPLHGVRRSTGSLLAGVTCRVARRREGEVARMQMAAPQFLTGFFVTVPLIVSVVALVWTFRFVDDFATPVATRVLGRPVPGLGVLVTALLVLAVGALATNVIGRRVLQRAESWLLRVPVFKTVYAPVKQLVDRLLARQRCRLQAGGARRGPAARAGAGVPHQGVHARSRARAASRSWRSTCRPTTSTWATSWRSPRTLVFYPELSVEDGIRIFLTGGMALPSRCSVRQPRRRRGSRRILRSLHEDTRMLRADVWRTRAMCRRAADGGARRSRWRWWRFRRAGWPRPAARRSEPAASARRRGQHPAAGPEHRATSSA